MKPFAVLCAEFSIAPWQAENIAAMLDAGDTLPFIARYRKERHGSLDDQVLRRIAERYEALKNLEKRRESIRASLEEQGIADEALLAALAAAATLSELEDLYRPYKPRRKTRADAAREKGLGPLAELLLSQNPLKDSLQALAMPYINEEKGVACADDALAGARDIIAERIADDAVLRRRLRDLIHARAALTSRAATKEDSVYRMYYEYAEPLRMAAGHRVLAMNRGEAEGFLKVSVDVNEAEALDRVRSAYHRQGSAAPLIEEAGSDAWRRLLQPSLEREMRTALTEAASEAAIRVFALNLRNLLMQPPVRGATVLALDPGIRTGCKAAVVDAASRVLDTGVIYPLPAHGKLEAAKQQLLAWVNAYDVSAIAIGNGTASRETQAFVAGVLKECKDYATGKAKTPPNATKGSAKKHAQVQASHTERGEAPEWDSAVAASRTKNGETSAQANLPQKRGEAPPLGFVVVDEAGASVYSASALAAGELPGMDVSLRGAVSLARRLQDPLAELVKIDPKAIGVGQYQHDMRATRLDEALAGVVEDCVNAVGVEVNTASPALLARVAGIGPALAENIARHREENGPFASRAELKKVKKLGPKAFEQCAGFLRIPGAKNWLDATAVHPESYAAAEKLIALLFGREGFVASDTDQRAAAYTHEALAEAIGTGVPTLVDILEELKRPGRDPRGLRPVALRDDVLSIDDLTPGMALTGTVRNVTDFGAFVDIGVHRDGLIHVSRMGNRRGAHPAEILKVGQSLTVYVLEADKEKNRISLSLTEK